MLIPKNPRYESKKYLEWVRQRPCMICGQSGADAHHICNVGNLSGMGMKADDIITMPLCRTCHNKMHREPSLWPDQWRMIALTLADAVKEGFFK